MLRTTVYLPDQLKQALARVSAETGISQALLIRWGVRLSARRYAAPLSPFGVV
ncbi:MAG: ribbon-helix-helix domain-containing protein [Dehalococcoidia bacterium]|nr:ribbon-helix-helix domain-containing protein [Dehalococcoidia bacterium]